MKKKVCVGILLMAAFGLWTAAVCTVDVQPIGPLESEVGFASLNGWFHQLTGVHMALYALTDWLSLIPIAVVMAFGMFGALQWVKRKHILKVDRSILVLGVFYIVTLVCFLVFEVAVINYRPVLIEGILESSYPSSTTLMVLCVMPAARMELGRRMKNGRWISAVIMIFDGFMVISRLLSGVHWLTDIIGGILLSASLVMLYAAIRE